MGNWESVFRTDKFSVQLGPQGTNLTTYDSGSLVSILCDLPQVSYRTVQSDTKRARARSGARHYPLSGRRMPVLAIKGPVTGQLGAYDFTSDTPDLKGLMQVLSCFDSTRTTTAYQSSCFVASGSDGNTWKNATSTMKMGALLVMTRSNGNIFDMGWPTAISGAGPYTATMFEDCGTVPTDTCPRAPTRTLCPRGELATFGWSVKVTGESTSQDRRFTGFVPESVAFSVEDDTLMVTVTGPCYGGEVLTNTSGGLVALTSVLEMDSIVSTSRYVLGGGTTTFDTFFTLNDGTADPDGSCDIRNIAWTLTIPHHPVDGPSHTCGVSAVTVGSPDIMATVAVPKTDEYKVSSNNVLLDAWLNSRNGKKVSLCCYYGNRVGRLIALRIPAGSMSKEPETIEIDGVEYWQGELIADSPYVTPDGSDSDCGNKGWTLGVG